MQLKLYSESSPLNPAFTGRARQVCASPTCRDDLINKVTAGSLRCLFDWDAYMYSLALNKHKIGVPRISYFILISLAVNKCAQDLESMHIDADICLHD